MQGNCSSGCTEISDFYSQQIPISSTHQFYSLLSIATSSESNCQTIHLFYQTYNFLIIFELPNSCTFSMYVVILYTDGVFDLP